jgi:hypothetical protein
LVASCGFRHFSATDRRYIIAVTHPLAFRQKVADLVDSDLGAGALLQFRGTGDANARGTIYATLAFETPAFGAADGTATITRTGTITSDTNTDAGTVATATLDTSGGTTIVHCAVTAASGDIDMTGGLTLGAGDTVSCSSLTYTAMP